MTRIPLPRPAKWDSADEAAQQLEALCGLEGARDYIERHNSTYCITSNVLRGLLTRSRANFP